LFLECSKLLTNQGGTAELLRPWTGEFLFFEGYDCHERKISMKKALLFLSLFTIVSLACGVTIDITPNAEAPTADSAPVMVERSSMVWARCAAPLPRPRAPPGECRRWLTSGCLRSIPWPTCEAASCRQEDPE